MSSCNRRAIARRLAADRAVRAARLGALLLAALSSAEVARASGFSVARFGGEHGHPTTDNPTALYFNPAGLSLSADGRALGDVTLALRHATYTRGPHPSDPPSADDALEANSGRAELTNVLVSPALFLQVPYAGFTFGVGWFTPFGGPVAWERRSRFEGHPRLPGPADGVQRWHSIEGHTYTSYFSLGVARRFGERLSVGLVLNAMGTLLSDVRARGDGTNDVEREGRALLDASGVAIGAGVGLVYEPLTERLWLGLSYQSRPNLWGGMLLHGTAEGNLGTTTRTDVDVSYDLPDVLRFGARFRPEAWLELRLFGDYTRWSAFSRQCIRFEGGNCELNADGSQRPGSGVLQNLPRDYRDSFGLRAGASVFTAPELEFFSGMGLDSQAVPDHTLEPALPDFTLISFTLGARFQLVRNLRLALSALEFLAVPRDAESQLSDYEVPSRQPDASGHYTQFLAAVNANLEYSF